jgi:OOP family OmpA-OmpF porin
VAGNGAALDSDGDGVANHLDAEPFTAKGARVDASGAALDSDGDGVADGLDVEKNTAPGAMVNFKGQTVGVANAAGGAAALLPSIYFKFGSASLTPTAYEQLTTVARYLSANPNMKLEIRGYCDPVGSEKYNQGLAERRASSVKSALSDVFKIESTRLSVNALGENDSLTDEYSINRRVDFVFN